MKVHGNQNLPPKIPTQDLTKSELYDDAPKRVTTHRAAVVETSDIRQNTRDNCTGGLNLFPLVLEAFSMTQPIIVE
jgi:hypothetical protein